ncbi:MAG: hypothetical protein WBA17_00245 [Saprospiraceae bacterium]
MTLGQFFDALAAQPAYLLFYFTIIPFAALLTNWMERDEGHLPPWNYFYSALIYLVAVPGIFAITLSIYFFLFERRSILDTDLLTQVVPVISMAVTLFLIKTNVSLARLPGFDRLGGLVTMIAGALAIMWILEKTHIYIITFLPFQWALLILAVLLLLIRYGWKRVAN